MGRKLTPAKRREVHEKYDGHCSYCGLEISFDAFEVDHFIPQARGHIFRSEEQKKRYKAVGKSVHSIENLFPACRRCNHYKGARSIRRFRTLMKTIGARLMEIFIFKVAVDYGLIEIKPFGGEFYFEKVEKGKE